jgi:hypothetical protein
LDAHKEGGAHEFAMKSYEAQSEFWRFSPSIWKEPAVPAPDHQLSSIWPTAPAFCKERATVIRFLTAPGFSDLTAVIEDVETRESTQDVSYCQFHVGDEIETAMRVVFPENGKYRVMVSANKEGVRLGVFREPVYDPKVWKFYVQGAPAPRRHIGQVVSGKQFTELQLPANVGIEPAQSVIKLSGREHVFKCRFQGQSWSPRPRKMESLPTACARK